MPLSTKGDSREVGWRKWKAENQIFIYKAQCIVLVKVSNLIGGCVMGRINKVTIFRIILISNFV